MLNTFLGLIVSILILVAVLAVIFNGPGASGGGASLAGTGLNDMVTAQAKLSTTNASFSEIKTF